MEILKRIFELKIGHGWFPGYARETDVISTIDSGMDKWHILLVEANEIIEREREYLSRMIRILLKHLMGMGLTWV